jgi:hypothetical protein
VPAALPTPSKAAAPAAALLNFLATLYVDAGMRERFAADPRAEARRAGFTDEEARELGAMNRDDLALAARSYARKRFNRSRSL